MNLFSILIREHYHLTLILGSMALMGALCGALGSLAFLQKQALMSDLVSHASLLGLSSSFYLSYLFFEKTITDLWFFIPASFFSGLLSLGFIQFLSKKSLSDFGTLMALSLSFFFSWGYLLLSFIQNHQPPLENQGILSTYFLGHASTLNHHDFLILLFLTSISLLIFILWGRDILLSIFDPILAQTLLPGYVWIKRLILGLLVLATVIGLRSMGIVLVSALLIIPAAIVKPWTQNFFSFLFFCSFLGALIPSIAILFASHFDWPVGPSIVLGLQFVLIPSLIFQFFFKRALFI